MEVHQYSATCSDTSGSVKCPLVAPASSYCLIWSSYLLSTLRVEPVFELFLDSQIQNNHLAHFH
jgi:hypothetical protein